MAKLHISHLTMSHFRSHSVVRLAVDPRPVAIFGPNGAGKTNLIEALSLLSPGRGLRRSSAEDMTRRPEALGWKIAADLWSRNQAHEIETWSEKGAARQVRVDGKSAAQSELGRVSRILWLIPAMDRLWIEGADGRRRFLDRLTLSFHPAHAQAALTYERAMRERNRLLKDMVRDAHWYTAVEAQMAKAGALMGEHRASAVAQILAAQDQAETAFPAADLTLTHPDGFAADLSEDDLLAALSEGRRADLTAGRTQVGPHRVDMQGTYAAKDTAAKDCSTGEQKALLISLILANARALIEGFGAPPILLLDEVAAHLDADRRAALYNEVCALGAQAWMTGTGAELFAELGDRAQYLEVTQEQSSSLVQLR